MICNKILGKVTKFGGKREKPLWEWRTDLWWGGGGGHIGLYRVKRSDYAKLCMSLSLDGTLPEYVISEEDNSPLTLYIDFHQSQICLDINSPFDPVHS